VPEDGGAWAAGLLVDEAWAAYGEGHYQHAVTAAARAAVAGEQLDDPVLLVRALSAEAIALRQMGDHTAALARYTRILGLAEDPATAGRLDHPSVARAVADAHWGWVVSARFLTGIPARELFGVLDAADRWLAATGHKDWRGSVLSERASVYKSLGEMDTAISAAEEALALKIQHPDAPGHTLGACRYLLGDILREAGRAAEAVPHYQAILDTPGVNAWSRRAAHEGLAWCALAAGDPVTGRREARAAVSLAESLGDDALCTSLDVLAAACRADRDLDAAWQVATRYLETAGRIGGHNRPYYAVRVGVDIALDRADLATAKRLLGELDEHAAALDATTGTTTRTSETAVRHRRLAGLETAPP